MSNRLRIWSVHPKQEAHWNLKLGNLTVRKIGVEWGLTDPVRGRRKMPSKTSPNEWLSIPIGRDVGRGCRPDLGFIPE